MNGDHPLFSHLERRDAPTPAAATAVPPASISTPKSTPTPTLRKADLTMTVSEACDLVETIIEIAAPDIIHVKGEISNWKIARSGHAYFTLRDEQSALDAVMWKRDLAGVATGAQDGMAVVASGRMRFYKPRGQLNFQVMALALAGKGELERRYRQLCQKLLAEGLFDAGLKRRISRIPTRIGLITSNVGDAVYDVVTTARRRFPPLDIILVPVRVQGPGSADEIIGAIELLNRSEKMLGRLDAILLVRGGGSLEDLWAFNDEQLARAIRASRIPIATGIGHEPDQTIADLVADMCGPTPTGIAERVVADISEVHLAIETVCGRIAEKIQQRFDLQHRKLDGYEMVLDRDIRQRLAVCYRQIELRGQQISSIEPARLMAQRRFAVQVLKQKMIDAMRHRMEQFRPVLQRRQAALLESTPKLHASRMSSEVQSIRKTLSIGIINHLRRYRDRCDNVQQRLDESHPDRVLERGFSMTTRSDGTLVRSASGITPGERLITRVADGAIASVVQDCTVAK